VLKAITGRIGQLAGSAAQHAREGASALAANMAARLREKLPGPQGSPEPVTPPKAEPVIPDPPPLPPDPARTHVADRPQALGGRGWAQTAAIVFDEIFLDRLFLVAAGVAFYVMLSIFPAMSVLIWLFALVADPAQFVDSLADVAFILPADALAVIRQQAVAVADFAAGQSKTVVALTAIFAIWSANAGMKAMIDAMNLIYGEDEKRSFLALNLRSLLFTLAAFAIFLISLAVLVVTPKLLAATGLQNRFAQVFVVLRWPVLFAATVVFLVLLNRYGPSRPRAQSRWALWGSVLGAAMWLLVSALFSFYVERLSNLAAVYGSLAAIAGLMLWLWFSALVILIGIELNHELEMRTRRWEERELWLQQMEDARQARARASTQAGTATSTTSAGRALPPPSLLRRVGGNLLRALSRK